MLKLSTLYGFVEGELRHWYLCILQKLKDSKSILCCFFLPSCLSHEYDIGFMEVIENLTESFQVSFWGKKSPTALDKFFRFCALKWWTSEQQDQDLGYSFSVSETGKWRNGAIMVSQSDHFGIKKIMYGSYFYTLLIRMLLLVQECRAGHIPRAEITHKTFV